MTNTDFKKTRKTSLNLENKSELEVMREYKKKSDKNFCIEKGFYPLGSCTMKYNPRINEYTANLEDFTLLHPHQKDEDAQGALKLMYNLQEDLKKITGMDAITLQPCAGAHGELTGMMIIKKYFESTGESQKRKKVIIPDSAHGTNPASAAMCGFLNALR
jgi:glycine dehydrogenase subunit 2